MYNDEVNYSKYADIIRFRPVPMIHLSALDHI